MNRLIKMKEQHKNDANFVAQLSNFERKVKKGLVENYTEADFIQDQIELEAHLNGQLDSFCDPEYNSLLEEANAIANEVDDAVFQYEKILEEENTRENNILNYLESVPLDESFLTPQISKIIEEGKDE